MSGTRSPSAARLEREMRGWPENTCKCGSIVAITRKLQPDGWARCQKCCDPHDFVTRNDRAWGNILIKRICVKCGYAEAEGPWASDWPSSG